MIDDAMFVRMIRVLCVDDVPDVGQPICDLICRQGDMTCPAYLHSNDQVLQAVREHQADVVLLDLSMPGRDSFEIIEELARHANGCKVLVFSGLDDQITCDRVFQAGAWGLVSKNASPQTLIDAIRTVVAGATVFPAR